MFKLKKKEGFYDISFEGEKSKKKSGALYTFITQNHQKSATFHDKNRSKN